MSDNSIDLKPPPKQSGGYRYYSSERADGATEQRASATVAARRAHEILNPSARDKDYLAWRARRMIIEGWLNDLASRQLDVLDIGGRVQPWRYLLGDRVERYVGLDPIFEGEVRVVAVGECLPFAAECFDLVICTQVLTYARDPWRLIAEAHRVLKPGATFILSTTAMYPEWHDERWRFLKGGLEALLAEFSSVEIVPEGHSIAGAIRLINVALSISSGNYYVNRALTLTLIPLLNRIAPALDRFSRGDTRFTTNYCVRAVK